jgi:hypothetical protein
MTAQTTISSQEAEEIRLLRAAEAMQTGEHPLEGAALETVITDDARSRKGMKRIKEIHGVLSADNELRSPIKLPNPPGEIQREVPKIGSRDAPGG